MLCGAARPSCVMLDALGAAAVTSAIPVEVEELGPGTVERDLDRGRAALPELGDDDLGGPGNLLQEVEPFLVPLPVGLLVLVRPAHRFGPRDVVFSTEWEDHDVRVLLDA